jgi:hypothetical protein
MMISAARAEPENETKHAASRRQIPMIVFLLIGVNGSSRLDGMTNMEKQRNFAIALLFHGVIVP